MLLHVRPSLGATARSLKIELVLVLRFARTHLRQGLGPLADSVGHDLLRLLPLGRRRIGINEMDPPLCGSVVISHTEVSETDH